MNIIAITGGLGNQMFQYALGIALKKAGQEIKLDSSKYLYYHIHNNYELEKVFHVNADYATTQEIKKLGYHRDNRLTRLLLNTSFKKKSIYVESPTTSLEDIIILDNFYLKGFWQNEKFFSNARKEVAETFKFDQLSDTKVLAVEQKIYNSKNSVSIHIRRGDYLKHPLYKGICDELYYKKAYLKLKKIIGEDPECFIFSNDIEWVKNNIKFPKMNIIDINTGPKSYIDMQLMAMCTYNIIANSSFSWWSAWLNKNVKKIIISPAKWINRCNGEADKVIPESWLTV